MTGSASGVRISPAGVLEWLETLHCERLTASSTCLSDFSQHDSSEQKNRRCSRVLNGSDSVVAMGWIAGKPHRVRAPQLGQARAPQAIRFGLVN
jgi:hypothetical protein